MKHIELCSAGLLAASAFLFGCSGGGDTASVAPTPSWQSPVLGAITAQEVIGAFPDASGGVIVVGRTSAGGAVITRFSAGKWDAESLEMSGLKAVQAVALVDGVALFGRDDSQWFRTTISSTGVERLKPQFPVEYLDPARTNAVELRFSKTFNTTILATSVSSDLAAGTMLVRMREMKQGVWESVESVMAPLINPFGSNAVVMRSRYGDVATFYYSEIYVYSFVAFRPIGASAFVSVTPSLCTGGRCGQTWGNYFAPELEADGSATVLLSRAPFPQEWLSVRSLSPTSLWVNGTTAVDSNAARSTYLLRADGSPVWLTSTASGLVLWEGAQRAVWSSGASLPPVCPLATCAAIGGLDSNRLAMVDSTDLTRPSLNVYVRGVNALWAQEISLSLASVRAASGAASEIGIAKLAAALTANSVLGYAGQANLTTDQRFVLFAALRS